MKLIRYIVILVGLVTIVSCNYFDKIMCGEPEGKEKVFIDSLNVVYLNRLVIKQVPCYPGYIQADLKTDVSKEILDNIEFACKQNQWSEFLVYDTNGILIRGYTGSM